jgi:molybdopterin/thiamine biosynthesis adenylyltransferase
LPANSHFKLKFQERGFSVSTQLHSNSVRSWHFTTRPLFPFIEGEEDIHDRAKLLEGYIPERWQEQSVAVIGLGGLGSEVVWSLLRKGVKEIQAYDFDLVSASNLNRQFFFLDDIDRPKAHCLLKNLAPQATEETELVGYAMRFEDAVAQQLDPAVDLAVCGVDNDATRVYCARYFYQRRIPCVFLAVSRQADAGYCFIQLSQPGTPCWVCRFPQGLDNRQVNQCAGANIDILKCVAGMAGYALDSVVMPDRRRAWIYKEIWLHGLLADDHSQVDVWPECPVCGAG